jgi:hypothetical protein
MVPASRRLVGRTGLAWLVWLALLLPFAQSAAAWHAYSHSVPGTSRDDGTTAAHAAQCELCLIAAAAGGPALPGSTPILPARVETRAPCPQAEIVAPASRPALAYCSRAPPSFSH